MATKSTKKSTTKAPAHKAATKKSVAAKAPTSKTVRECVNESEVLRFHMKIITILSVLVCVLVAALVYSLTR